MPELLPFTVTLLAAAVRLATPVLFAALGETITEKAGVLNIGIEGTMLVGAFAGFAVGYVAGNPWYGVVAGILAGCGFGLIIAYLTVTRIADQIVVGILINIVSLGLTSLVFQRTFAGRLSEMAALPAFEVPGLSAIPFLGQILFRHMPLVYVGLGLVPVVHLLINHTPFGLALRTCGENPRVADTAGIDVHLTRYLSVVLGAALMGLAGAVLSVGQIGSFQDNLTAGRGFIALAVVALGKWNAYGVLLGALLFGLTDGLQLRLQALGVGIPHQLLLMVPYILTILVLVGLVGGARYPDAAGKPYLKEAHR